MKAKEYILSQLESLKNMSAPETTPNNPKEMTDTIFKLLMSKKFRKYSVPEKNQKIIYEAIEKNITNNEPIKITWPFGGYKLWRLEESPEVDWAELFTLIYIAKWLRSVCSVYPKGIDFTFWVDEVVISKMNNIPQEDLEKYQESFADLLKFIKPWLPQNLNFEVFLEREQYESQEAFENGLKFEMDKLEKYRKENSFELSEANTRSIEMNVNATQEQLSNPGWREKIDLMHYAYYNLQEKQNLKRAPYVSENIAAFATFFEPNVIPIGTTKTSIVKFWIGVGVLEKRDGGFIENILSLTQLEKAKFEWEQVEIAGLAGKNFSKIRIV